MQENLIEIFSFIKKNIIAILTILVSSIAAFFTYQSVITTKNLEISNQYTQSVKLIRDKSEEAYRYTENVFRAFEEYISNVNSDQAYKDKGMDAYNLPAEKIRNLSLEIDIKELEDELNKIEGTQHGSVADSAQKFNQFIQGMVRSCSRLNLEYRHFGETNGIIKNSYKKVVNIFSDDEELIKRRQEIMMDKFKDIYKECAKNFNQYESEKNKFLNEYKKVLKKI